MQQNINKVINLFQSDLFFRKYVKSQNLPLLSSAKRKGSQLQKKLCFHIGQLAKTGMTWYFNAQKVQKTKHAKKVEEMKNCMEVEI